MRFAYWLWNVKSAEGGDPLAIARVAKECGITDVLLKIADGPYAFNVEANKRDRAEEVVRALKAVGVKVWGWQYYYGSSPLQEAAIAAERCAMLGIEHFIVDAEGQLKERPAAAEPYLTEFRRRRPSVTLAYSSYRWPSLHREFPWAPFNAHCTIAMPQVYWEQAHNPAAQLDRCLKEYKAMAPKIKVMPAGSAYKWNGWKPEPAELVEFHKACEANGLEMASYWSWEHTRRDLPDAWKALVAAAKSNTDTCPQDDRLEQIEKRLVDISALFEQATGVLGETIEILRSKA